MRRSLIKNCKSQVKNKASRALARRDRRRSNATFVCVTGSSGKSTTTSMLSHILEGVAPVFSQVLRNDFWRCIETLRSVDREHRYAVLELGSAGPGTLQPMIDLVKPSVGVVTLVALEHYTAFRSLEAVTDEKRKLVESLPCTGLAVLNHDDPRVASMASWTRARVATFGMSVGDYQVLPTQGSAPGALVVPILHNGQTFTIETRLTGSHNSLLVGAVFACAHQLGVPVQTIAERFASFQPLFGRCSVHPIENGPIMIADTCKAPYHSVYLPISMMAEFTAPRRRIIVGQISDYAGNPLPKYRDVYRACRRVADQVLFVGENAHRSKAPPEDVATGRFVEKRSVEEAADFVKRTAIPGEIILLKSSQGLHVERILLNFEQQARCWEQACGRPENCWKCGFVDIPFPDQKQIRKARQALHRLQPSRWEAALLKALPSAFLP